MIASLKGLSLFFLLLFATSFVFAGDIIFKEGKINSSGNVSTFFVSNTFNLTGDQESGLLVLEHEVNNSETQTNEFNDSFPHSGIYFKRNGWGQGGFLSKLTSYGSLNWGGGLAFFTKQNDFSSSSDPLLSMDLTADGNLLIPRGNITTTGLKIISTLSQSSLELNGTGNDNNFGLIRLINGNDGKMWAIANRNTTTMENHLTTVYYDGSKWIPVSDFDTSGNVNFSGNISAGGSLEIIENLSVHGGKFNMSFDTGDSFWVEDEAFGPLGNYATLKFLGADGANPFGVMEGGLNIKGSNAQLVIADADADPYWLFSLNSASGELTISEYFGDNNLNIQENINHTKTLFNDNVTSLDGSTTVNPSQHHHNTTSTEGGIIPHPTNFSNNHSFNTLYTNTGDRWTIHRLTVDSYAQTPGDLAYVTAYVNGTAVAGAGFVSYNNFVNEDIEMRDHITFNVAPGETYQVNYTITGTGAVAKLYWMEDER